MSSDPYHTYEICTKIIPILQMKKGKDTFPQREKKKITDPKSQGQIQTQVAASIVSAKI